MKKRSRLAPVWLGMLLDPDAWKEDLAKPLTQAGKRTRKTLPYLFEDVHVWPSRTRAQDSLTKEYEQNYGEGDVITWRNPGPHRWIGTIEGGDVELVVWRVR